MGIWERRYGTEPTRLSRYDGEARANQVWPTRSKMVVRLLLENPQGLTAREINDYLSQQLGTKIEIHCTRPMLTRLGPDKGRTVALGIVEAVDRKLDPNTGIKISVWRVRPDAIRKAKEFLDS